MLALERLQKAEIHWFFRLFSNERSVLGGEVPVTDLAQVQHRVMMIIYPLSFLRQFLEVCFFVVALVATKNLTHVILDEQRPDMIAAVRGIVPRFREVLLFSLKYMAVLAAFGGVLIVFTSSPLTSERLHELAFSKVFLYACGLVVEGCLAWLLVPAAIRLLRPPGNSTVSAHQRKTGVAFAVATSASSLALDCLVRKAETLVTLENQWEGLAFAIVNTIIINAPQVLLFIALALMASQWIEGETSPAAEPKMKWVNRLFDCVRRAREWRGGSF